MSEHAHLEEDLFTEKEWANLQVEDLRAAQVIGGLMAGIFSMGVFIYTIVLYSVFV